MVEHLFIFHKVRTKFLKHLFILLGILLLLFRFFPSPKSDCVLLGLTGLEGALLDWRLLYCSKESFVLRKSNNAWREEKGSHSSLASGTLSV